MDAALDKDGARSLAASKAGALGLGPPADKRNLYLSKEGHIEEGSAAWAGMSEYDRWGEWRDLRRGLGWGCRQEAAAHGE